MVYITGDIHGSPAVLNDIYLYSIVHKLTSEDYLIVLGDAGFNYYLNRKDETIKKQTLTIPEKILCIHGNHEARPDSVPGYQEMTMFGGKVYIEEKYPNLIFLKDGEIYNIDGHTFLVLGGAYSVDKFYRIQNGWAWFDNEQISIEERTSILKKVQGLKVDYVLSHTCPYEWEPRDLFLPLIDQSTVDNSTELWLTEVEKNIEYKKWFFGHFHDNREKEKYQMLYHKIISIK